jgi:hypothetical protein
MYNNFNKYGILWINILIKKYNLKDIKVNKYFIVKNLKN